MNAIENAVKDYAKEVDNEEFIVAQEKFVERINKVAILKDVLREKIEKWNRVYSEAGIFTDKNGENYYLRIDKGMIDELLEDLLGEEK